MKQKEKWCKEYVDQKLGKGPVSIHRIWLDGFNYCKKLTEKERDYDSEQEYTTAPEPVGEKE